MTTAYASTTHPEDFFVVHALMTFSRNRQPITQWGSLSDGPYDRDEATVAIDNHFRDNAPTLGNLRVYHFRDDAPARDVTEDFILEWEATHAPTEDEMMEQAACDRGDDAAHYARECGS